MKFLIISIILLSGILITLLLPEPSINLAFLLLLNLCFTLFFVLGNILLAKMVLQYSPRQLHKYRHLIILIPVSVVYSFCILTVHRYALLYMSGSAQEIDHGNSLVLSIILSFFIITAIEGYDFFSHWKEYVVHAEKIEKANLLAQYETLKNQVNPHFLFNGLNTLISFIETKDNRAAPFAQNLSDFLKYLLTNHKEELVTLENELSLVKQYIYLQQSRFDENLEITINLDSSVSKESIPPLALQMLVENAIKHNKISTGNPLKIEIYNENDYVFVRNNKQLKKDVNSTHIGIDNIKGRYSLFTSKEVLKKEDDRFFIIGIPLIPQKDENSNY